MQHVFATILVIAADRKQARVIMRYINGLLSGVPALKKRIEREAQESVDLTGFTIIEVATANFRTVRGYTLAAALCDEIGKFSPRPSSDMQRAARVLVGKPSPPLLALRSGSTARSNETVLPSMYCQANQPAGL
ncbi:MAG: hypothetical protein E5Y59_03785 [Mesorhizobium sp.]|nr:MAG: hypothetical protein E5Y59_03785 [Mesorhizobium sp.]